MLGGYTIVECESFDRPTEIAAQVTKAPSPGGEPTGIEYVEVRPLVDPNAETPWEYAGPSRKRSVAVMLTIASRICCVSWRLRFSAQWSDATGTSIPWKTRRRRR